MCMRTCVSTPTHGPHPTAPKRARQNSVVHVHAHTLTHMALTPLCMRMHTHAHVHRQPHVHAYAQPQPPHARVHIHTHMHTHSPNPVVPHVHPSPDPTEQATPLTAQWSWDQGPAHLLGSLEKIEVEVPGWCEPAHTCLGPDQDSPGF